jgi:hypothetical protein
MPAESARLFKRLGVRDRWFVGLATAAVVVGTPLAIVFGANTSPHVPAGCVTTIVPHLTGGATRTYCGAAAVEFCRRSQAKGAGPAAQCAKLEAERSDG